MLEIERLLRISLLLCLISLASACATIFNSKSPPIEISTTPPGASVTIGDGLVTCVSPCREPFKPELSLPITITLPGHSEYRGSISRVTSAYFWINGILFPSGLLGMGLDYFTGSMWTWENVSVIMTPLDGAEANPTNEETDETKENSKEPKASSTTPKETSKETSENPSITPPNPSQELDAKTLPLNKEASKPWRDSTNGSPFPTEVHQDIPKNSRTQIDPVPTANESAPAASDRTGTSQPASSKLPYPRQLVMRRLEWHLGLLSEAELKARTQCVYKIIEGHQGGADLDLDMAINLMIENHLDHCD